jgi:predicted methyltransferase
MNRDGSGRRGARRARVLGMIFTLALWACSGQDPSEPGSNAETMPDTAAAPLAASTPQSEESAPPADSGAARFEAIVAASDRTDADRGLDAGRRPAELLAFIGLKPGMRVAEIAAGGGYTTELLVRAVQPGGKIYGQNSPALLERFLEQPWSARLQRPVMQSVERLDRSFEDPFPAEVRDLDAVVNVLFYHDVVWIGADRAAMNRAVFQALRPGGVYVIVDHSARPGAGVSVAQTLHRIEESVVKSEVEAAGFTLAASADFLREPGDARDWNASPREAAERRGTSDRFVLKFVKP